MVTLHRACLTVSGHTQKTENFTSINVFFPFQKIDHLAKQGYYNHNTIKSSNINTSKKNNTIKSVEHSSRHV